MKNAARKVMIIGHRGCAAEAPENTLASIRRAWDQLADAVEIDVHLTRDGVIVAHHDFTTRKTAGVDRSILDQTLAELKEHDVGRWKDASFSGERIPTLMEVLQIVPPEGRLLIEVKCGAEIVPALTRDIRTSSVSPEQVVIISFDRSVISESKRAMPDVEAAWIVEVKRDSAGTGWLPPLADVLTEAARLGADGVDFGYAPPFSPDDLAPFRAAGMRVYIWTVNTLESAVGLSRAGVDGLTTDRPGSLRAELDAMSTT